MQELNTNSMNWYSRGGHSAIGSAKRFNKLFLAIAQVALRFKENKSFLRFIALRTEKIYNSVRIIALRTEKNLVACALLRCALSEVEILRCALSD